MLRYRKALFTEWCERTTSWTPAEGGPGRLCSAARLPQGKGPQQALGSALTCGGEGGRGRRRKGRGLQQSGSGKLQKVGSGLVTVAKPSQFVPRTYLEKKTCFYLQDSPWFASCSRHWERRSLFGGSRSQVLHLTVLGGRFASQRGREMVYNSMFSKVTNCFQKEFVGLGQVLAGINGKFLRRP